MKKLLLTLFSTLLTITLFGQTIIPQGSPTQLAIARGGYLMDSILKIPVRGFTPLYALAPYKGRVQLSDDNFYFSDGISWIQLARTSRVLDSVTILKNQIDTKYQTPTGTSSEYLRGDGVPTIFPSIPNNTNQLTNGAGFISTEVDPTVPSYAKTLTSFSSIKSATDPLYKPIAYTPSGSEVISGLGYTPYNGATNPNAYLSSINSSQVTTALGYTPVSEARTITINGLPQTLAADRSWTILNISGNSGTATSLQTPRTINGQSFDGTSNITIPGSAVTSIPNTSLTNSSVTVNGTNIALGGSATITASTSVGTPSSATSITMGTAFQPRAGGASFIAVSASLTGALGLNETITIAMSATSGGTYTTVATDQLLIGLLGLTLDRAVGTIPVPAGWWVRVTRSGSAASATYTKWDL